MAKLVIHWSDHSHAVVGARAQRVKPRAPMRLTDRESAVLFLRQVASRAANVLPTLYLQIGAIVQSAHQGRNESHHKLLAHTLRYSTAATLSMTCRQVFDHARDGMSGKRFARAGRETLVSVADYWCGKGDGDREQAMRSLVLLQTVFSRCSELPSALLSTPSLLQRRVGLLKAHADRSAAHLSMDYFEVGTEDFVHFAAALVMLGALIVRFDDPELPPDYIDRIDVTSLEAAKAVFPALTMSRLFDHFKVLEMAETASRWGHDGIEWILDTLPGALGWWVSTAPEPIR